MDMLLRFHTKIRLDENGCHEWVGAKNSDGYGHFYLEGKLVKSHRFAYELYKGCIKKGLELDHLCKNRQCCNPIHLEAVTHKENVRRGDGGINNSSKTHCVHGHEFTKENTSNHNNKRHCITCANITSRRHYLRNRESIKQNLKP